VETGRFAPSPTGSLHLGSLVAAVGSWLFARRAGGRWLVRMEDIDATRVVPGSAEEILGALQRYGLEWDGEVVWQSRRLPLYENALMSLRAQQLVYDCACSRAELRTLSSRAGIAAAEELAVAFDEDVARREAVYPGRCRDGLPAGRHARAIRFRVPNETVAFTDAVCGPIEEHLGRESGDFIIRRADGLFAYQLAVVVDDAEQGVTEVVRGGDLLNATARQIALQRALGYVQPRYAHLPLIVDADGAKLGKRDGSLPLPTLDERTVATTLSAALRALGIRDVELSGAKTMLDAALRQFQPERVPQGAVHV
jgi:glutamyl-Q tRNA(Asp) synthetase